MIVHRDNLHMNNQQDTSSIQNFILSPNSTCFRQRPHNLHETYQLPRVQLITPDDGHRRCRKHVEFRDKIKFWTRDTSCWLCIRRYVTFESSEDIYMVSDTVISCSGNSARTVSKKLHFLHPPKVSDADIPLFG